MRYSIDGWFIPSLCRANEHRNLRLIGLGLSHENVMINHLIWFTCGMCHVTQRTDNLGDSPELALTSYLQPARENSLTDCH